MRRPIGIDLFSGAGGMSLGFEQAGFDVLAAVELDPIHAAVHKFNFPDCAIIPKSIVTVTGDDIRALANLSPSESIEVVFGGPPCQGFSMMGQRSIDDPRNGLVKEFVRVVSELRANYFVFENVKGLTVGSQRKFLDEIIEAFDDVGYDVVLPWKVLNSVEFCTPQDRQRLILMGAKRGLRLPAYPAPITHAAGNLRMDVQCGPSCEDALQDLPDAEDFDELLSSDEVVTNRWGPPSKYAAIMRCIGDASWWLGYRRIWDPRVLTSSMRAQHTDVSRSRFAETKPGTVEPISRFFRLHSDGVSNTLRAGTDAARGAFTSPRPIHYAKNRCITVREMARLHGFPDWFRFHETKWHGARQIGNAVPPPLARAVATELIKAMRIVVDPPTRQVKLGSPALLKMDMSQASRFWGIDVPIGKRDRKSGIKKRKQISNSRQIV